MTVEIPWQIFDCRFKVFLPGYNCCRHALNISKIVESFAKKWLINKIVSNDVLFSSFVHACSCFVLKGPSNDFDWGDS